MPKYLSKWNPNGTAAGVGAFDVAAAAAAAAAATDEVVVSLSENPDESDVAAGE